MVLYRIMRKVAILLEMIKFAHTIFALPFALMSVAIGMSAGLDGRALFWILVAMVGARSSAMAFNRIADLPYDAANPRTASRAIPQGQVSLLEAWLFVLGATALFLVAAAMLNRLTLLLAPVALGII